MKKNNETLDHKAFMTILQAARFRCGPAIITALAFTVSVVAIIGGSVSSASSAGDIMEFEPGRVAERDVIAEEAVSYVDEEATRIRAEAQERLVPAVFTYSIPANVEMRNAFDRFRALSSGLFNDGVSSEAYKLAVQAEFPGAFSGNTLDVLFRDPGRDSLLEYASGALNYLLETGVFALPQIGLESFNPDVVELLHNYGPRTERELINYQKLFTKDKAEDIIDQYTAGRALPSSFKDIAVSLLSPFITENVFFSPQDTNIRLAEVRAHVEPVVQEIQRGDRIIRKGFIITNEDMIRLRALNTSLSRVDPRVITGQILILLLMYSLVIYLSGKRTLGRTFSRQEIVLLAILSAAYLIGATLVSRLSLDAFYFPVSLFLPTALVVMLPSILLGSRIAITMAIVLPLSAFVSGSFDIPAYIFALTSGVAAAFTLHGAQKRMDLVKAGFIIAGVNGIASLGILFIQRCALNEYLLMLFWSAFNGVASGMLVLGCLPLMEQALNAATTFRLIELSDLNAPVLKRLFTAAPGTYSHSIMVANLAEAACQEIGANALLARVGAYYHDIGKMEQPDYFVENQTVYNKHNDIAPRLSATVIRSHVKLGVEKGRYLGLPDAVIDIIAEHHGNSVISWFYHEALKRESQVDKEDFTYPGNPPRSRESAVVMLADVTEAAVRTLKKPSASRLEKFIQELIMSKFEQGQLSESELTFRDLETIKKTFVRVLAGHYHSRIEYPKMVRETSVPAGRSSGGDAL
jgi:putative nucleotidyltransferase with HDIG domain